MIIKTASGIEIPKDNCVKINDEYYIKNKECFYIYNSKTQSYAWETISSHKIGYDVKANVWRYKDDLSGYITCLYGRDENGQWKIGYFKYPIQLTVNVSSRRLINTKPSNKNVLLPVDFDIENARNQLFNFDQSLEDAALRNLEYYFIKAIVNDRNNAINNFIVNHLSNLNYRNLTIQSVFDNLVILFGFSYRALRGAYGFSSDTIKKGFVDLGQYNGEHNDFNGLNANEINRLFSAFLFPISFLANSLKNISSKARARLADNIFENCNPLFAEYSDNYNPDFQAMNGFKTFVYFIALTNAYRQEDNLEMLFFNKFQRISGEVNNSIIQIVNEINHIHAESRKLKSQISVFIAQQENQKNSDDKDTAPFYEGKCLSEDLAKELGFTLEAKNKDCFYYEAHLTSPEKRQVLKEGGSRNYNLAIDYNVISKKGPFHKILDVYKTAEAKKMRSLTKDSFKLANLIGPYTLGYEFETAHKQYTLREDQLYRHGLVPLRDGSIGGYEYATVPFGMLPNFGGYDKLTMAEDLVNLKQICEQLSNKCTFNNRCSFHIHIGNARRDKLFMMAFYQLCCDIEDELFKMFPLYKRNEPKYIGANKKYCQELPKIPIRKAYYEAETEVKSNKEKFQELINFCYNEIFHFVTEGQLMGTKYNRHCKTHPNDPDGQRKWNIHSRYHWVNLVGSNLNPDGTIEFRLHTPTFNFTKVINWTLICVAIVRYAEHHIKEILSAKEPYTLDTIISGYTNGFRDKKEEKSFGILVYNYLMSYIYNRMDLFSNSQDATGEKEAAGDKNFIFEHQGIVNLM